MTTTESTRTERLRDLLARLQEWFEPRDDIGGYWNEEIEEYLVVVPAGKEYSLGQIPELRTFELSGVKASLDAESLTLRDCGFYLTLIQTVDGAAVRDVFRPYDDLRWELDGTATISISARRGGARVFCDVSAVREVCKGDLTVDGLVGARLAFTLSTGVPLCSLVVVRPDG